MMVACTYHPFVYALTMEAASFLAFFEPKRYSGQRVKTPKTSAYLNFQTRLVVNE
jgi:hypothetical protein